jgi:hypothetical protein
MKNNFEITLKDIRYYPSLSQETNCFTAKVYINGVKSFYVENDGHGGNSNIIPHGNPQFTFREVDNYCKSLPKIKVEKYNFEYEQTFETKIDDLFEIWLKEKENLKLKKKIEKLMVNNIVCQPKGELDIQCHYWQDKNKKNVPIELLISKPNFNKIVMDKVAKLKNEGYTILNTNIPNI